MPSSVTKAAEALRPGVSQVDVTESELCRLEAGPEGYLVAKGTARAFRPTAVQGGGGCHIPPHLAS